MSRRPALEHSEIENLELLGPDLPLDPFSRGLSDMLAPLAFPKEFEVWCRQAGFDGSTKALDALCKEGTVTSYRIQSGRIRLFLKLPN